MGERKGNKSCKGFWHVSQDHLRAAVMEIAMTSEPLKVLKAKGRNTSHLHSCLEFCVKPVEISIYY